MPNSATNAPTSVEEAFQAALTRYNEGEAAATLLPTFVDLCRQDPKNEILLTCLSWLYLLEAKGEPALKAAQHAVKLSPLSAQSRVNLVLAMLETQKKGIRQEVERIQQILQRDPEQRQEILTNLQEGCRRRPDWPGLQRLQSWLGLEET